MSGHAKCQNPKWSENVTETICLTLVTCLKPLWGLYIACWSLILLSVSVPVWDCSGGVVLATHWKSRTDRRRVCEPALIVSPTLHLFIGPNCLFDLFLWQTFQSHSLYTSNMSLTKLERDKQKLIHDKCQMILAELLRTEDNKYCVDCDSKGMSHMGRPLWFYFNYFFP